MKSVYLKICFSRTAISLFFSIILISGHAQIVSTLAGAAGGFADGIVSKVKFHAPWGITVDTFGNVYVADHDNNCIRKITPAGIVTTFAGNGLRGYADGMGTDAKFYGPNMLAVDLENNIYVADQGNNRIRKITPLGSVSTIAGNGIQGKVNGQAKDAEFYSPSGVAVDSFKNVYVADQWNNCIRKISSSGIVSTLAGGYQGYQDGVGINSEFNGPNGITVDAKGNVYVAEIGNNVIRKITPAGEVSTLAGDGTAGYLNGIGTNAEFYGPLGLVIDKENNIFVADIINNRIRKINSAGLVTTITSDNMVGFADGTILNARFANPWGIAIDKNGSLYISDLNNNAIRKIDVAGIVSTIAGNGKIGYDDGLGSNPEFNGPNGTAADAQGNIYVADLGNNRIRKISPDSVVTTIAGTGVAGYADGPATAAEFNGPSGIALDEQNNIYVTEAFNNRIRKITPAGIVSTLAGNGTAGFANGPGTNAAFNHPNRLCLDKQGNVYVADLYNQRIRKITPGGAVSTLAGNGVAGFADGTATNAQFNYPDGIAVDPAGNVFVADYNNNRIREITPAGMVTTFAGNGFAGYLNGTGVNSEFNQPGGIAITAQGDFYVSDESSNRIRKITSAGVVSLYAGNGIAGYIDTTATRAEFNDPRGLCVDLQGNIYVPDFNNNRIRKITASPPLPITLLNFKAYLKGGNAILQWQTAMEENTNHFVIQRSKDGINFFDIGNIKAADYSNTIRSYNYTDQGVATLNSANLFYRLAEVDNDGKAQLSNIVSIDILNGNEQISIYPNPASSIININLSKALSKDALISVYDISGKRMMQQKPTPDNLHQQLSIHNLPSGKYELLITEAGKKSFAETIIIAR